MQLSEVGHISFWDLPREQCSVVDQCLGRKWFPDNCWRPGQLLICASRAAHQLLSSTASLLTELIVCVSVCMVKLLNNREHIFRGASRTYKIKIPVGLEGPAGRAGQTGRLAAWQLPPRFTGLRGSVLGQPLDQGPKDSGLRLSGKSGAQKLARCRLELGFCRALDFPGALTLKQVALTNRRRGNDLVKGFSSREVATPSMTS